MKNTVLFITPSPIVTRWSPRGRGPPARCPRACAGTSCPSPDFFLTTHQKGDQVQKGDQQKNWTQICFKQNEILMFGLKKTGLKKGPVRVVVGSVYAGPAALPCGRPASQRPGTAPPSPSPGPARAGPGSTPRATIQGMGAHLRADLPSTNACVHGCAQVEPPRIQFEPSPIPYVLHSVLYSIDDFPPKYSTHIKPLHRP